MICYYDLKYYRMFCGESDDHRSMCLCVCMRTRVTSFIAVCAPYIILLLLSLLRRKCVYEARGIWMMQVQDIIGDKHNPTKPVYS